MGGSQVLRAAIQVSQRARGSSLKGLHEVGDLKGEEDVVLKSRRISEEETSTQA